MLICDYLSYKHLEIEYITGNRQSSSNLVLFKAINNKRPLYI